MSAARSLLAIRLLVYVLTGFIAYWACTATSPTRALMWWVWLGVIVYLNLDEVRADFETLYLWDQGLRRGRRHHRRNS